MNSFNDAISLNNEGVSYLCSGQDKLAAECLVQALSIAKTRLSRYGDNSRDKMTPGWNQMSPSTARQYGMLHTVSRLPNLLSDGYFIYNQAISFPPSAPQDDVHALKLYSACMILNLGLAYHRRAKMGFSRDVTLKKAEIMYEMAAQVVERDPSTMNIDCCTKAFVFTVAVNNLSQIHFEQGKFEKAKEGVAQLSSIITRNARVNQVLFREDELKSLLLNVMLHGNLQLAPAA